MHAKKKKNFFFGSTLFQNLKQFLLLWHFTTWNITGFHINSGLYNPSEPAHFLDPRPPRIVPYRRSSGLTSALPSCRPATESTASSSSRTQDFMSPPSLRSRKRPAGHLAVRRPIPRMHREPLPGVVCRAARAPFLYPPTVSVSTSERRVSKRWLTRDSRTGQTSDSVHHTAAFEKKKKKKVPRMDSGRTGA